jgi:hypothetical protein
LKRIVLTMVVAAGSYAALAFLIAAKGLVRSEEFEKSRDLTEYFLIGSLSSVLVALCAGLALRYALLALWPDLLVLQMQQGAMWISEGRNRFLIHWDWKIASGS